MGLEFKKHVDTVIVLGSILSTVLWMNGKFNDIEKRFSSIEKDFAVIKTVLMMKNILPCELCKNDEPGFVYYTEDQIKHLPDE